MADIVFLAARYYDEDLPFLEDVIKKLKQDDKIVVVAKEIFNFKVLSSKTTADIIVQSKIRGQFDPSDSNAIVELVEDSDYAYFQDYKNNYQQRESDLILNKIESEMDGVILLDRMDYICNDELELCHSINMHLQKYFYDYGHHTLSGAEFYGGEVDRTNWLMELYQAVEE